jgi:hypothetical protein
VEDAAVDDLPRRDVDLDRPFEQALGDRGRNVAEEARAPGVEQRG